LSGTPCRRPRGQTDANSGYRPSTKLDFELEVGFFVGAGSADGSPLALDDAEHALFGCCLVNDWSARDIQRWEAMPLGPFLAKSFLTTVSPWIVTLDALAPFRRPAVTREADAPMLAPELESARNAQHGAIDIALAVSLQSRRMREADLPPVCIAQPNFRDQYWNIAQMVTHHTSNGCGLRAADLVSSGTVSGPDPADSGCLLERTSDGRKPLVLPSGELRGYLDDGDVVRFTARCERPGYRSIGFGECTSEVVGAVTG
jgi:fumarylacetoacetase